LRHFRFRKALPKCLFLPPDSLYVYNSRNVTCYSMEEVIGSIPIMSTNYSNNLDDLALFEKGPKRSNKSLLSFGPRV
jgi:hypothetical protein